MPEQSQPSHEFSPQESSSERDVFSPVTRLTPESSDQDRMDVLLQISDTPVKVLRHSGAIEDWKIAGLGEEDDSGHPMIEVYRQSVTDKEKTETRTVPVDELRAWQSEEGLKKAVEANTEQVDWSKIPAIGDRKSGRFLSVADIQQLREERIKPFPGGTKGSAAYETRGQKAQETVDILLPQDKAPQDGEQARRYEVRRNALKAALVVGEQRFSEKKQVWLERYGAVNPVAQPHKKPDVKETTNIVPPETRTGDPPSGNEPVELTDEEQALIDRYHANKKSKKSQTGDQSPNDVKKYLKKLGFDENGNPIMSQALPTQPVIPVIPPPGTDQNTAGSPPAGHEASPRTPEQISGLESAREAKQKAYVELMKGPVFRSGAKREQLRDAYDTAQDEYSKLLNAGYEQHVDAWVAERKNTSFITEELAKIVNADLQADIEAQRQLLIKDNGKMGELLDRYANLGRGKKIVVGLGLGAIAAGTGFGLGLLAGAVGAAGGAALIGGASAGGLRLFGAARTYNLRKAELFKKQDLATFKAELNGNETPKGLYLRARDFIYEQSKGQVDRGERIKKSAVYWTLGSVALGAVSGVAGTMMHSVWSGEATGTHWQGGQTQHWLEQWQNRAIPTEPGNGSGGGGVTDGEIPSTDTPDVEGAHHPGVTKAEVIKEYLKEHGAAKRIDRGEGWFQTFKELGISAGDRRAFLEEYGDDLLKKFPEVTYKMPNGEPGILMTDDGKMPKEVLEYIVKHANQEGWLKHSLDFSQVTENGSAHGVVEAASNGPRIGLSDFDVDTSHTATGAEDNVVRFGRPDFVETGSSSATAEAANKLIASQELVPANTVSNGETFTRTLNELRKAGVIDVPSDEYRSLLRSVGPRLAKIEYSDGTPVAYLNRFPPYDWRLNQSPDGRLHAKAIRLIERVASERGFAKVA